MSDERRVLPFYVVADVSGSMAGAPLDAINNSLPDLHDAIRTDLVVADKVRFGMIDFADDGQVQLPLSDLSEVSGMPTLSTRGGTSYAAAFWTTRQVITADVDAMRQQGMKVFRPAIFFFSDGEPTDDKAVWTKALSELQSTDFAYHPNIISFGFGEADSQVLGAVATLKCFMASQSVSPAQALKEFVKALVKSIVKSGHTVDGDKVQVELVKPEGFEEAQVVDVEALW